MKYLMLAATMLFSMAVNAAPTWIIIGDSIMSGVARDVIDGPEGHAKGLTANLLSKELNINIRNISVPASSLGSTDHTGFGNITNTLSILGGYYSAYEGIIIQAGTNDYGRGIPWEDTVVSLRAILNHAQGLNKKVLVMDPIWRSTEAIPNHLGYTIDMYRYMMYIVCVNEFPNTCKFAHRVNSVLGTPNTLDLYDANEKAAGMQLHLNTAGHRVYTDWIKYEMNLQNLRRR